MLCNIEEGSVGLQVWDPRQYPKDRFHLMPIINPTYPYMNSSYNVSSSTLRIMTDEFERGNKICEAMEAIKADWNTLFEPYPFFEAYKNYLQIDVSAANDDDLRKWKGCVESHLCQLTLKIERHTVNMLQCHPYPGDFSDKAKPFHCCYFMGLQRKRGVQANEGEQFDIRLTVEEFKHSVGYTLWKPGMEIRVSHVKRRNIPSFVFPGGVGPSRPAKVVGESRQVLESKVSSHSEGDKSSDGVLDGLDDGRKRKRENENVGTNLEVVKCLTTVASTTGGANEDISVSTSAPCSTKGGESKNGSESHRSPAEVSSRDGGQSNELVKGSPPATIERLFATITLSSSKKAESHAIEEMMSGPYVAHQAFPEELEELEDDFEYRNQVKYLGGSTNGAPTEPSTAKSVVTATSINGAGPFSSLNSNGGIEELEPTELVAQLSNAIHSTSTAQRKPLIRLNLSPLAKTTDKSS